MINDNYLDYVLSIENVVEIGEEISQELEIVTSVMRDNVEHLELFLENNNHTCRSFDKSVLDFVTEIIKNSKIKLNIFEEELESFSNYNSDEELLVVDNNFLDKLNLTNELNIFLRIQLEEYISSLNNVKTIVDEITTSLNKQRTEQYLGSRMLM
ncbi:MAG: hypothetical protein GXY89_09490 [Tissierellia bacterium]|nr:hypothetical protein [Tissierellia bacterium]